MGGFAQSVQFYCILRGEHDVGLGRVSMHDGSTRGPKPGFAIGSAIGTGPNSDITDSSWVVHTGLPN